MKFMEKKEKLAKKIIEEFFKKMNFGGLEKKIEELKISGNVVSFKISADEPEILIGKRGQILFDMQSLLSKILSKKIEDRIFVDFDINDYKKEKNAYLEGLARDCADEAILNKKEKFLPPMSSYERRIIHVFLSERKDVFVESEGEEPDRRIIIKPANL